MDGVFNEVDGVFNEVDGVFNMVEDFEFGSEERYSMSVQPIGGLLNLMTAIDVHCLELLGSPSLIDHGAGRATAFQRN